MKYTIQFNPRALKDLSALAKPVRARVFRKIEDLSNDLAGDVKRLTNYDPAYRLRVGDWRVLFDLAGETVVIHRVLHRSEAYE